MCWLKSDSWGIFAHLQAAPQFDIIHSNGQLYLRDSNTLNLRVIPALSQGDLTKPAWSLAWPSHWGSCSASLPLPSLPPSPAPTSFQLKPLITIYKEVFVLQKCSHIYDSSNLGGNIQPKDLIGKYFLSLRIVIFIIITLFPLL